MMHFLLHQIEENYRKILTALRAHAKTIYTEANVYIYTKYFFYFTLL
jgi:hypothetical protein